MSFLSPDQAKPPEPKVEGAPPPVLGVQGKKPGAKNQAKTFLGDDSTPAGGGVSGDWGAKTLVGS